VLGLQVSLLELMPERLRKIFRKKMPAEGLFALRAHPFGVALKGDRRRCASSSNPLVYVGGSTNVQVDARKPQEIFEN
jgi:hypothetical protein